VNPENEIHCPSRRYSHLRAIAGPALNTRNRRDPDTGACGRGGDLCPGGGGIPVVALPDGSLCGVEAVIDKDLTAALLAEEIAADALLLLTDVPAVWTKWPRAQGVAIGTTTPHALPALSFAPGSMAPKVAAACGLVERTGRLAAIGAVDDASSFLAGNARMVVRPSR
jgi:carbamate kinase